VRAHWSGLDGLRGAAALAVVVFHADLGPSVNGYAGVDVFFVLSGFLITSLVLREHDRTGAVSLSRFYVRRVLRLYPALAAACLGVVALAVVTGRLGTVGPAALATLLYVSNWWIYLGHPAPLLEHTWTLAIEEHFYLFWPPVLTLLLGAAAGRRRLAWALIALASALLVVRWPGGIDPARSSYARGVPIVWGATLAMTLRAIPVRATWLAVRPVALATSSAALLALLAVPFVVPQWLVSGPAGIAGLLSVVVVAAGATGADGRGGAWSRGWLVWLGRRSYGLYLYHFPVLSLMRHQVPVGPLWLRMVAGILLTLAVTAASYRWLELPFLRLKDRRFGAVPAPR
jgi:peptidoglycan/LPS O-acetylase OafA/YrhL